MPQFVVGFAQGVLDAAFGASPVGASPIPSDGSRRLLLGGSLGGAGAHSMTTQRAEKALGARLGRSLLRALQAEQEQLVDSSQPPSFTGSVIGCGGGEVGCRAYGLQGSSPDAAAFAPTAEVIEQHR